MRPATGWIAYLTSTPLLLELVGELLDRVLGLRDGEPVAGDDHDRVGVGERDRRVLGADRAVRPLLARARPRAAARAAEAGEQDVRDRAVHRRRHLHRQDRSRRADERAGDDQGDVVEREAGGGRGEAGGGVEQRDHDRHVGAADRQHGEDAEQRRADQDQDEEQLGGVVGVIDPEDDAEHEHPGEQQRR